MTPTIIRGDIIRRKDDPTLVKTLHTALEKRDGGKWFLFAWNEKQYPNSPLGGWGVKDVNLVFSAN